MDITALTPSSNRDWAITGKVTAKTAVRSWTNSKGGGTLFSFDLCGFV